MNKKFLFGMFAAATMLFATSCSNDELDDVQSGKESVVSFTLEQPGITTRAYSDGTTATTLTYAVYEKDAQTAIQEDKIENAFENKTATVSITLKTGKSYDIIFWADAPDSPYDFDSNTKSITVNDYETALSNDENRDAFFGTAEVKNVSGPINEEVKLKRPFAQLNFGVDGSAELPEKTSVTVSKVYKTLNLMNGEASEVVDNQTFAENGMDQRGHFPVAGFNYLAMNYLLVDNEQELVDVTLTTSDGKTVSVPGVPVQRNYRTNIYGRLLDPVTDDAVANFTVEIKSDYEGNLREDLVVTPEFVDLGLDVTWATFNIGAQQPEQMGGFFAWGDTDAVQWTYNWEEYALYTGPGGQSATTVDMMSAYNETDDITVLTSGHDAAAVNWGQGRVPKKEDFQELIDKCTWVWDNTRNGYTITSNVEGYTDKSIFLPGSFYKNNRSINGNEKEDCMYWTSTLGTNKLCAFFLDAKNGTQVSVIEHTSVPRKCGMPIRPVKDR